MSDKRISDTIEGQSEYRIMLPCTPAEFGDFISTLLGKPQTISGRISGVFEIKKKDIENIYYLVTQRVFQQNEAQLTQFSIRINYADDTSVTVNSFDDFTSYREVQPKVADGVELTFIFLIRFRDKKYPEKQQIDISFRISERFEDFESREARMRAIAGGVYLGRRRPGFRYAIHHTARTWGVDIESLLQGHLRSLRVEPPRWKTIMEQLASTISITSFFALFSAALVTAYYSISHSEQAKLELAMENTGPAVSDKLDYILETIITSDSNILYFGVFVYLLSMFFISMFFAISVDETIREKPPSALLLTDRARDLHEQRKRIQERSWIKILGTIAGSLALGLASNYLFAWLDRF